MSEITESQGISVNAQNVLQAVYKLYHDKNATEKEKASKWLGEFQRSVFAWETADELLRCKKDVESTYFAAQTMRTKVLYSFQELPSQTHESLKESLLNHIEQLCNLSPILVTQLSLALCDLALQMPSWKMPAVTFMQKYGKELSHLPYLLELLTVLPEEVNNRTLRLGENRRAEILEDMENAAPMVVDLLKACVEIVKDEQLLCKIFKCLGSWFNLRILPGNHVARCKLLDPPFSVLKDVTVSSNLYESACDCICAALYSSEDIARHSDLIMILYQGTHSLREAYQNAVAHEDTDKCLHLGRVFTELAENLLEILVNLPGEGLGDLVTLDLLLLCNGHCQYEVTEITFNFWFRLSEMVYLLHNSTKRIFGPYIERLICTLVTHCQMEPDNDKILDSSDDFYEFRLRASELVRDVVYVVGASECFVHLFSTLNNNEAIPTWDVTEATLFIMSSIAKYVDLSDQVVVPQVLQAIFSLPQGTHIAVYHTSVQLVGELSAWIEKHPQMLEYTLSFLTTALQNKELASVGAISLQYLCETCQNQMAQHCSALIQLMQVSDDLNVSADATLRLLTGVVTVSSNLSLEQVKEAVGQLCSAQITVLSQHMSEENLQKTVSQTDPVIWLDRLACILRHVNVKLVNGAPHPCKEIVEEMWPVFKKVLEKFSYDNRIVERWCRCLRFAIRCVGWSVQATLLQPVVETITLVYAQHAHSCCLYLGSVLVDEYGSQEMLLAMLNSFAQPTLAILNEENGLEDHPDTVDDFFRLCSRFMEKSPIHFLSHSCCPSILQCALTGLNHKHRDASASVTKFLRNIIECSATDQNGNGMQNIVSSVVSKYGGQIVEQSLQSCLFHIPTFLYPDIAELWWSIIQRDRQTFSMWFMSALKNLPTETSLASATPEQAMQFHTEVTQAKEWKKVSYLLRDFCRLYR
ncbi:transportin-3-like isoform X2 [Clavelina lepadiformis]|uniref:transportin-3-like isoform X2 n=1 Tax=Clavelina lepadiformis TaxID=159417 RepID=UPI0040428F9D